MKILVITYSREVNPGTFLQAYGVQYGLKQIFPDSNIEFIRHTRLYSLVGNIKGQDDCHKNWAFIKAKLFAIPRRLKYECLYKKKFSFTQRKFDLFDYDENDFKCFVKQYDLICVGSDTILINIERNNHIGLMWLKDIENPKVFFAASAAPVNFVIPDKYKRALYKTFMSALKVGVRDEVTSDMLTGLLGVSGDKIEIQPDPTYLIPESTLKMSSFYSMKLERIKKSHKIALVNFDNGFQFKREITREMQNKGFYVISTHYNVDADWNIMTLSPFEWGALFRYVDITITDRFHDSVFTLRNNKLVFAIDWDDSRFSKSGFSKTNSLLKSYNLVDYHLIIKNRENYDKFLHKMNLLNDSVSERTDEVNSQIKKFYLSYLDEIAKVYFIK